MDNNNTSIRIIAELYKVCQAYQQTSDKNAASQKYCETATQVLDRLEREVESYEERMVGLWVVLGYISDYYPQLVPGPSTTELCHKLFRQCARTVLNIEWQQLPDEKACKQNFQAALQAFDNLMKGNGYTRFSLILSLINSSWTHTVLSRLMSWDEEEEHSAADVEEGEQYIQGEDPVVLKLRVEMLLQENCEEFALSLCGWCLKHPALKDDLDIHQTQLSLLHRLNHTDRLQEECQKISCHDGVRLIKRLQLTESNGPLCTILAQTFLIQDWIRASSMRCCTKDLLKLWIQHQSQVDQDEEKFLSSIWAVAKLSNSSELIGMLIESLRQERGDELAQLYTDLFRFGLNLDKKALDKLKAGDQEAQNSLLTVISGTCRKLGEMYADIHTKTAKACYLTAFALHPSQMLLHAVERCWKGPHVSVFPESETQDLEHINDGVSRDEGIVSIASLYEIERLLEVLRPCFLSPDNSWDALRSVCEKYLFEKQALAKQRALQSSTPSSEDTDLDSSSILETSSQDSQDSGELALTEEMFDPTASPSSLSQQASAGEPSPTSSTNSPASSSSGPPPTACDRATAAAVVSSASSILPTATQGSLPLPQMPGVVVQVSLPSTVANFRLPISPLQSSSGENLQARSSYSNLLPSSSSRSSVAGILVNQQRMPNYSMAPSSGTVATASATTLVRGLANMAVDSGEARVLETTSAPTSTGLVGDDILRLAQETVAGLPTGSQVFIASTQVRQQLIIALTPSSDGNLFMPDGNTSMGYTPRVQVSNNPVGIFPNVPRFPSVNRRPILKSSSPSVVVRPAATTKPSAGMVSKAPGQASVSTVASTHISTRLPSQDGGSLVLVNPVDPNATPCMSSSSTVYPDGSYDLFDSSDSLQVGGMMSHTQERQPGAGAGRYQGSSSMPRFSELASSEAESSQDALIEDLHPSLKLEGGLYTEVDRSQPKKKKPLKKKNPATAGPYGKPPTVLVASSALYGQQMNRNLPIYCGALTLPHSSQNQGAASTSLSTSGKLSLELGLEKSSPGARSSQGASDGPTADDILGLPDGRFKRYNKNYFTTYYKCIICGLLLDSFTLLRKHVKDACKARNKRNKDSKYEQKQLFRGLRVIQCTTCQAMCETDRDVKYHQEHCVALRLKRMRTERGQDWQGSPRKAAAAGLQPDSAAEAGETSAGMAPKETGPRAQTLPGGNPYPSLPKPASTLSSAPQTMGNPALPHVAAATSSTQGAQSHFAVDSVLESAGGRQPEPASQGLAPLVSATAPAMVLGSSSFQGSVGPSAGVQGGAAATTLAVSYSQSAGSGPSGFGGPATAASTPSDAGSHLTASSNHILEMESSPQMYDSHVPQVASTTLPQMEVFASSRTTYDSEQGDARDIFYPERPNPPVVTPASADISMGTDTPTHRVGDCDLGTVNLEDANALQLMCTGGDKAGKRSSPDTTDNSAAAGNVKKKRKVMKKVNQKTKRDGEEIESEVRADSNNSRKRKYESPPAPMYDVVKSSGGNCFYKCRLCNVSFSSLENFSEHWECCLQKNPPSKKTVKRQLSQGPRSKKPRSSSKNKPEFASDSAHSNPSESDEVSPASDYSSYASPPGAETSGGSVEDSSGSEPSERTYGKKKKKGQKRVCEQCKLIFSDLASYVKHICSRHIQSYDFQNTGSRFKFTCTMCQCIYSTFFAMMNHTTRHASLVLKIFSEKIADGTVKDYDEAKHAKLQRKARMKAARLKQLKEAALKQAANGMEKRRKKRRKTSAPKRDRASSDGGATSTKGHRGSKSRQSSEGPRDDQTSTSKLDACMNKIVTHDVRVMLSDINYPGSEFSREIQSYNNATNHADQGKAKEKREVSDDQPGDEDSSAPEEQSEDGRATESEMKGDDDDMGEQEEAVEETSKMEVDDAGQDGEPEDGDVSGGESECISLLSEMSSNTADEDRIALDYQAGDGPSLSDNEDQAEEAAKDAPPPSEAENSETVAPDVSEDEKFESSVVEEAEEIARLVLEEIATKVEASAQSPESGVCQQSQESSEKEEEPCQTGVPEDSSTAAGENTSVAEMEVLGSQDSDEMAESQDQSTAEVASCSDAVAEVLSELLSCVSSKCEEMTGSELEELPSDASNAKDDSEVAADSTEVASGMASSCSSAHKLAQEELDEKCTKGSEAGETEAEKDVCEDDLPAQTASETPAPLETDDTRDDHLSVDAARPEMVEDILVDDREQSSMDTTQTAEPVEEGSIPAEEKGQEELQGSDTVMAEVCQVAEGQLPVESDCPERQESKEAPELPCSCETNELLESDCSIHRPKNIGVDQNEERTENDVLANSNVASEDAGSENPSNEVSAEAASFLPDCFIKTEDTSADSHVTEGESTPMETTAEEKSSCGTPAVSESSSTLQSVDTIKVEAVEEVQVPPPPPKRGRGRPRKRPLVVDSSAPQQPKGPPPEVPKVEKKEEDDEDMGTTCSVKTRLKKATQGEVLNRMYNQALRDATWMSRAPKPPADPSLRNTGMTSPKRAKRDSPLRKPTVPPRTRRSIMFPRRVSPQKDVQGDRAGRQSPQKAGRPVTTRRLSSQSPPGRYPRKTAAQWESSSPAKGSSNQISKPEPESIPVPPTLPRRRGRPPTKHLAAKAAAAAAGRISSSVEAVASPQSGKPARGRGRPRGTSAPTPCTRSSRSRSNPGAVGAQAPNCRPSQNPSRAQPSGQPVPLTGAAASTPRAVTPRPAVEVPVGSVGRPRASSLGNQRRHSVEAASSASAVMIRPAASKRLPNNESPASYQGSYMSFLNQCGLCPDEESKKKLDVKLSPVSEAKLEGVKVLRDSIKKKPFSWDVEEEDISVKSRGKDSQNVEEEEKKTEDEEPKSAEDSCQNAEEKDVEMVNLENMEEEDGEAAEVKEDDMKTEKEPIKVLREQVSVAPFTWDLDEGEDNQSPPRKRRRRSGRSKGDSNSCSDKDDVKDAATSIEHEELSVKNSPAAQTPAVEMPSLDGVSSEGEKAMEVDKDSSDVPGADKAASSKESHDQKTPNSEKPTPSSTEGKPEEPHSESGGRGSFGRGRSLRSRTQMVLQDTKILPAVVRKPSSSGQGSARGRGSYDGNLVPRIQVYRVDPVSTERETKARSSRAQSGEGSSRTVHTPVPIEDMKKTAPAKASAEGTSEAKTWTIAKKNKTKYPYTFTRARGQKK